MIVRAGLLALLVVFGLSSLPRREVEAQASTESRPGSDFVYRGRVLDRETLLPVPGIRVRRVDGKVEVTADPQGLFAFPMEEGNFGACHWSADGSSVGCSMDDPETTRFFLRGEGSSPMVVAPGKYRSWEQTTTLLVWRAASIHGVWLDSEGRAVAQRELALEPEEVLPYESEEKFADLRATTDEKGGFHFDQVAARVSWSLRAANKEDKLVELDAASIRLAPGEKREWTVRSLPTVRVSGVVRDSKGKPRKEAGVVLEGKQGNLYADSASDGTFEFDRVGVGAHRLKAMYPDEYDGIEESALAALQLIASEQALRVDLRLSPVEEIAGRVLDAHGEPVGDAEIWFEPEGQPYSGRVDVEEDGSFRMPGLFAGECRMMASGPDRAPRSPVLTVKTGTKDLALRLEPTGRLAGRVVVTTPTKEGKVSVYAECVSPRPAVEGLDPGGTNLWVELEPGELSYEFAYVPCGSWRVHADIDDEQVSAETSVTVDADKLTTCADLLLKPSATLWLIGAPGLGALEIEVWNGDGLQARTEVADGRVGLLHVPAGALRIVARGPKKPIRDQELELAPLTERLVGIGFGG